MFKPLGIPKVVFESQVMSTAGLYLWLGFHWNVWYSCFTYLLASFSDLCSFAPPGL